MQFIAFTNAGTKKEYYSKHILKSKGNTKEIWRIIISVTKTSQRSKTLSEFNIPNSSQVDLREMFNDFFIDIFSNTIPTGSEEYNTVLPSPLSNTFIFKEITSTEIITIVKQMPLNKAMGHDEILINILKGNTEILCPYLELIFNQLFLSGVFPEKVKIEEQYPSTKPEIRTFWKIIVQLLTCPALILFLKN